MKLRYYTPNLKVRKSLLMFIFFQMIVLGVYSQYIQLGSDINGESDNDNSGYSISMSKDGQTVAIGAGDNNASGIGRGHVRIYKYTSGIGYSKEVT